LIPILFSFLLAGCSWPLQTKEPVSYLEEPLAGASLSAETADSALFGASAPETMIAGEATASADERTLEEAVLEALDRKYGRRPEDIKITVEHKTNDYAAGSASLVDEIGTAWWLAARVGREWRLVAEGSAGVSCGSIETYNFPAQMVPECYDHESGEMIDRK